MIRVRWDPCWVLGEVRECQYSFLWVASCFFILVSNLLNSGAKIVQNCLKNTAGVRTWFCIVKHMIKDVMDLFGF